MIKTMRDVEVFMTTLKLTGSLWHADDMLIDVPSLSSLENRDALQEAMNQAKEVCEDHNLSIFDFYED